MSTNFQPILGGGRYMGQTVTGSVPLNDNGLSAFAAHTRVGDPFGKGVNVYGGGISQQLGSISSAHVGVQGTKFGTQVSGGFRLNF